MAWETYNPALASHDLVQDLKWDKALRERFAQNEASAERAAIEARDFRALYDLGMHPYLGGQLARFIWGNEAGGSAITAANRLVASLQGKEDRLF
jgi:protocatechuate 4,5-dioxygenase alpha chain